MHELHSATQCMKRQHYIYKFCLRKVQQKILMHCPSPCKSLTQVCPIIMMSLHLSHILVTPLGSGEGECASDWSSIADNGIGMVDTKNKDLWKIDHQLRRQVCVNAKMFYVQLNDQIHGVKEKDLFLRSRCWAQEFEPLSHLLATNGRTVRPLTGAVTHNTRCCSPSTSSLSRKCSCEELPGERHQSDVRTCSESPCNFFLNIISTMKTAGWSGQRPDVHEKHTVLQGLISTGPIWVCLLKTAWKRRKKVLGSMGRFFFIGEEKHGGWIFLSLRLLSRISHSDTVIAYLPRRKTRKDQEHERNQFRDQKTPYFMCLIRSQSPRWGGFAEVIPAHIWRQSFWEWPAGERAGY